MLSTGRELCVMSSEQIKADCWNGKGGFKDPGSGTDWIDRGGWFSSALRMLTPSFSQDALTRQDQTKLNDSNFANIV
jgi:hypothetical protein